MKNVISYSLYGNHAIYLAGAIQNAILIKKFFPHWVARFYIGKSVSPAIVAKLYQHGCEIIKMHTKEDATAMFWRFRVFADEDIGYAMIRDADSRLSIREAVAVKEWLSSGKDFHIMRDHPQHSTYMLGGLWGAKSEVLRNIEILLAEHDRLALPVKKGMDQEFLTKYIYPQAINNSCIHASFHAWEPHAKAFQTQRQRGMFVGEVIDEHEKPSEDCRKMLIKYETNFFFRQQLDVQLLKIAFKVKLKTKAKQLWHFMKAI